jgi:drug/metabolite transporter superfamily protein YnfA
VGQSEMNARSSMAGMCSTVIRLRDDAPRFEVAPGVDGRSHRRFVALGLYGIVATGQPSSEFGRVLAAYGGIFVAGSLLCGVLVDRFRPDRYDLVGAAVCLVGVAVIM